MKKPTDRLLLTIVGLKRRNAVRKTVSGCEFDSIECISTDLFMFAIASFFYSNIALIWHTLPTVLPSIDILLEPNTHTTLIRDHS